MTKLFKFRLLGLGCAKACTNDDSGKDELEFGNVWYDIP